MTEEWEPDWEQPPARSIELRGARLLQTEERVSNLRRVVILTLALLVATWIGIGAWLVWGYDAGGTETPGPDPALVKQARLSAERDCLDRVRIRAALDELGVHVPEARFGNCQALRDAYTKLLP